MASGERIQNWTRNILIESDSADVVPTKSTWTFFGCPCFDLSLKFWKRLYYFFKGVWYKFPYFES